MSSRLREEGDAMLVAKIGSEHDLIKLYRYTARSIEIVPRARWTPFWLMIFRGGPPFG